MKMADSLTPKLGTPDLNTKHHDAGHILALESEEFNALRKELYDHWRDEPSIIERPGERSLWYYSGLMVTNPPAFVEIMSMEIGERILFDSDRQAEICFQILNGLRRKRGALPFARA